MVLSFLLTIDFSFAKIAKIAKPNKQKTSNLLKKNKEIKTTLNKHDITF